MSFAPGENVGPYRVVAQLGSGGMATVYKAYHAALDRFVALKVLHPAFKGDANFLARFQREARVIARLEHPNIVPVYDFSEHEGSPYLVIRFIEGETLKARLEREQLTLPEILDVVRPMGEALAYAHEQGILHRDVKPSNVLLSHDGGVFLTDFGLARIVQAGESSLTRDAMVGTPYYISPEQAIGKSDLDARTDIYAFGVVLYELFTGRVPFQSDTPFAVVHDHIYTPLPLPTSINPNLPPALERVLLKAMAKEPDDRYGSAAQLVEAVEQAVTGMAAIPPARPATAPADPTALAPEAETATVPAPRPAPTLEPAPEPTVVSPAAPSEGGGRRWLFALGGLAVLVVLVLAATLLLSGGGDEEPGPDREQPAVQDERPPDEGPPLDQELQPRVDRVRELLAEGNVDAVIALLEEALRQDPRAAAAYIEVAQELAQQGDFGLAAEILRNGVEISPDDAALHLGLAQMLIGEGHWEEAEAELFWLVENVPDMAEAHAYLSVHLAANVEDLEGAQREAIEAREFDPDSPATHFAWGVYYLKTGELIRARRELEQAREGSRMSPWLERRIEFFLRRIDRPE